MIVFEYFILDTDRIGTGHTELRVLKKAFYLVLFPHKF